MEPSTSIELVQGQPIKLSINIANLLVNAFPLGRIRGKKRFPARMYVPVGRVAVAAFEGEVFDRDQIPEVYLPGEIITRKPFQRRPCYVAELAQQPGTIRIEVAQVLHGLSLTSSDPAIAGFEFPLRLEDPIALLSKEARWMDPEGPENLVKTVTALIEQEVGSTLLNTKVQIWSNPDVREVARIVWAPLNERLRSWGLRIECLPAYRRYPIRMYEIALQLRAAERHLLNAEPEEQSWILTELGLQPVDRARIDNYCKSIAPGAGLFLLAREKREHVEKIAMWLEAHTALDAAVLLRNLYSEKFTSQETEITEQVLLAAFRYPMLGLGEWADEDQTLVEASKYRQLETYLKHGHAE